MLRFEYKQSMNTLDQMAPRKKKYIRGNNMPFFNKELKNYLAHKKKNATKKSLSRKKILSK